MKVNLLYANPQLTRRQREKGKTGTALYRSLISQYLAIGVVFAVIFGGTMLFADLYHNVGVFTNLIALFTIIGLTQTITAINNVFFESKDLKDYLPLPLNQWAVFVAKFSVIVLIILPMEIPAWLIFILAGVKAGRFIGISIAIGTIMFVLFYTCLFLACSTAIFSFAQTKVYQHHQKLMTFLMTGLSMVAMFAAIFVMNTTDDGQSVNSFIIPGFSQLHQAVANPFSMESFIVIAILLGGIAIFGAIMQKILLPKVLSGTNVQQIRKPKRKHKSNGGMTRQFIRYNLGLLKNPNLLMQSLSMTIFPVCIFTIIFVFQDGLNLALLPAQDAGVTFLAGIAVAVTAINQGSLVGVFISLDRQNLSFIKSLPIDFKSYLWLKFKLIVMLQGIILMILAIALGVLTKLIWLNILTLSLGVLLGNLLASAYNFTRDWRLLDLTWTNATQLFNRGGGNLLIGLVTFGTIIIGATLITVYILLVRAYSPLLINSVAMLLIAAPSIWLLWHYYRYWLKANLAL
ncbi:hypothetical protein FC98_GL000321 [Lentilactobacillus kisonensis DSM 19906 = JCM 15041]|uniref:ABC superfamily ATP binding cassette transporter, membrane protein n=3 Tax=Lentilactobacillus kisonensis TaxID=481722 RepID=A0A0R1NQ40_9LACO|nr:hypothetical protein FC98_GL000321 [Lentilactobacillus kisonensis DSM 19906 = JCM 15041]